MHGTTMVFLAVMPLNAAFFNYLIPLMIGARDVAFPRLNALSYWIFLGGALFLNASFLVGTPPDGGWFGYASLTLEAILAEPRCRLLGARTADPGRVVADGRRELHRHHPEHARARHDPHADAGVRVDDPGRPVPGGAGLPARHRGPHLPHVRPLLRHPLLRRGGGRRPASLAAPLLDLRPPRGLHPDPARASASSPRCCRPSRASPSSARRS